MGLEALRRCLSVQSAPIIAVWRSSKRVGLITQRSKVRVFPPLPMLGGTAASAEMLRLRATPHTKPSELRHERAMHSPSSGAADRSAQKAKAVEACLLRARIVMTRMTWTRSNRSNF